MSDQAIFYPAIVRGERRITIPKKYGIEEGAMVLVRLEVVSKPEKNEVVA